MILRSLLRTLVLDFSLNAFFEGLPGSNPLLQWQTVSVGDGFDKIVFWKRPGTRAYYKCKVLEINEFKTTFEYEFDESELFQFWDGTKKITSAPTQDLQFNECLSLKVC